MAQSVSFQFHNGTIKTMCRFVEVLSQTLFQFYNGTIKTQKYCNIIESCKLFQFHNGTIKTPFPIFFNAPQPISIP